MNPEVLAQLEKAETSLAAAGHLLRGRFYEAAVSSAYYAMFHAAEALLEEKRLDVSSHRGVISAIGAEFVRIGLIDRKHGRRLHIAFERRREADYETDCKADESSASETINWAREFLDAAKVYLEGRSW